MSNDLYYADVGERAQEISWAMRAVDRYRDAPWLHLMMEAFELAANYPERVREGQTMQEFADDISMFIWPEETPEEYARQLFGGDHPIELEDQL